MEPIVIGADSSIQDGVVIHFKSGAAMTIGENTSVAHRSVVHGPARWVTAFSSDFNIAAKNSNRHGERSMKHLTSTGIAASLALALSSAASFAAEPHVHGAGTLQLVLEGGSLNAELRLPAMDVVGFEHAPREPKHKEAVKKAVAMLKDARKILAPPDAAQCTAAPGAVESELLEGERHAADDKHDHDKHDHDKHEAGHDHADGEAHADFEAVYRFDCRRPEALKQIKVLVFQQLPKLERLDVEMVTPAGQRSQRLVPGQDTIVLP